MMLATQLFLSLFLSLSAQSAPMSAGQGAENYDPIGDYERLCLGQETVTVDCAFREGLLKQTILEALESIEFSGDQRGCEEALAALDFDDEPEIQIAASRILGQFPDTPGVNERVPRLLLSPYPAVQQMAARVLSAAKDQDLSQLGREWLDNHQGYGSWEAFEESPVPPQPAQMGIEEYPGAVRYPPAESASSAAWLTPDPPAKVIQFYSQKTGVKATDASGWEARQQQLQERLQEKMMGFMTSPAFLELQKLLEEYGGTQDARLLEKVQELQREVDAASTELNQNSEDEVLMASAPKDSLAMEAARYLFLEEKENRLRRVMVAYPVSHFNKTVVRLIWDPELYGRAWGN